MNPQISHSAGGIVTNDQGEVIVVEQKNNTWSLPKGHVELDEDNLTAAKREIGEETGVTELEFIKEFPPYERFMMTSTTEFDPTRLKKLQFFLFKTSQTELRPTDPDNPQARWVEKSEVMNILSHPKDREFFQSIIGEI